MLSEQERLMRQISAHSFSAWELHIFLDTHPNNAQAAQKLKECQQKVRALTKQYEEQYGPINETSANTSRWAWISGPWPWETEANE